MKERNYYFDNIKGFLIICVILGNSLEYANLTSEKIHYFILCLYMFHMPLFTFISGYFAEKSSRSTQEKVSSIFKIYVGMQIFYFVLEHFYFENDSFKLEFFSPSWTLWYLLSLMCWYIISDFIKDKKKWFIVSLILGILIGFDNGVGSYASISRTFVFLPFFIAGMMFKTEYIKRLKNNLLFIIVSCAVIFCILLVIAPNTPVELLFEYTKYTFYFDSALYPLFIRIFHYIGAFTIGSLILSIMPSKPLFKTIGANSLIMYVSHSTIIRLLYKFDYTTYDSNMDILKSELLILGVTIFITFIFVNCKKYISKRYLISKK